MQEAPAVVAGASEVSAVAFSLPHLQGFYPAGRVLNVSRTQMQALVIIRSLNRDQRNTFVASFLGWTLDAFDFFLVTFVVVHIAHDFRKTIPEVFGAVTATLIMRPAGALIFGLLADRYGRRVPLMVDIVFYSAVELATAFSPNFAVFFALRALFGIGMGGEWGVGAALAMEALPARARGLFSGILQEGYAFGYLLAAVAFFLVFHFFGQYGWRAMFVVGSLPALLVLFIRSRVPESQVWRSGKVGAARATGQYARALTANPLLFFYAVALMAAFNFMSHGTQDLYPTFLQKQHAFGPAQVSLIAIIANVGAICGGLLFGQLSQRFGRRRSIISAVTLAALMIPLWAFSAQLAWLALGGFLMQFMVQGAWGIIPAHLTELAPAAVRGTFPGLTYQLGNMISAGAAQIEAAFAARFQLPAGGADYARALAVIALAVFLLVVVFTAIGRESKDVDFAAA
jgi:SHS family lactate transporter-like MFS transporter